MTKMCMLEENKICDNCLECNYCGLNPGKICDNCAKCIDTEVVEYLTYKSETDHGITSIRSLEAQIP